jgi:Zn-dependent protease with chaperone function
MASTRKQDQENFERIAKAAETMMASHPWRYRFNLWGLVVLGYAMLYLLLMAAMTLLIGCIWLVMHHQILLIALIKSKLIIGVFAFIAILLATFRLKIPKPEGRELKPQAFPIFNKVIKELSRQLKTPKIHRYLLVEGMNAGIVQRPKLGLFGWQDNTLLVGITLLLALSPEQAKAVLAHELGHLSENHARFNAWIYQIRTKWQQVADCLSRSGLLGAILGIKFFNWYAPYFYAYSFALARHNEYEADAISAELTSPKLSAQALVTSRSVYVLLDRTYWRLMDMPATAKNEIPDAVYTDLASFLTDGKYDSKQIQDAVNQTLLVETQYADTHPALKDRISALGMQADLPQPVVVTAAKVWFGDQYDSIVQEFDRAWAYRHRKYWQDRSNQMQKAAEVLTTIKSKLRTELTREELLEEAFLTTQVEGELTALPLYQSIVHQYPTDMDALLNLGRLKLMENDASGITCLQKVLSRFEYVMPACESAIAYYRHTGNKTEAEIWQARADAQLELMEEAKQERSYVNWTDEFTSGPFTDLEIEQIRHQLTAVTFIKSAWLCQKLLKIVPELEPVYVLTYRCKNYNYDEGETKKQLISVLKLPFSIILIMEKRRGATTEIFRKAMEVGFKVV